MNYNECRQLMTNFLMNQNAFYRLRLPISFLIAIIVAIAVKSLNDSDILISTILLPITILIFVWIMIYIGAKKEINETQLYLLIGKCLNKDKNKNIINKNYIKEIQNNNIKKKIEINKKADKELNKVLRQENIYEEFNTEDKTINTHAAVNNNIDNTNNEENDEFSLLPLENKYYDFNNLPKVNDPGIIKNKIISDKFCLMGDNSCNPICSGIGKNSCNLVNPIPGPSWQVQTAEAVQNRLNNGNYTKNTCPIIN